MRAIVMFAVVVLVAADDSAATVKKEMALLDGDWAMVSGAIDGQPLPDSYVRNSKRVAKDGVTDVTIGGRPFMKAKFTVDPTKKPKAIDYEILDGAKKGQKMAGIYELNGDTLNFCFAEPGKDRPTEFTAKAGSGWTVSVWKREKK